MWTQDPFDKPLAPFDDSESQTPSLKVHLDYACLCRKIVESKFASLLFQLFLTFLGRTKIILFVD